MGCHRFLRPHLLDSLHLLRDIQVAEQKLIDGIDALHGIAITYHMAIIEQIVSYRQLQEQE